MQTLIVSQHRLRAFAVIVICAALTMFCASVAAGQMGNNGIDEDPGIGMRQGRNTVVGQVIFPGNMPPARRCTVRISSVRLGEFSTLTDANGVFTFRRLREGMYFLTVEAGKEYHPAQTTVDLFDNSGRTTTVQVELRPRATVVKAAVVDAGLAGAPKQAVELYQKGLAASRSGDYKKAVEHFLAAVNIYPEFVLALNELAGAYINAGQLAQAERTVLSALAYEPDNPTLRLNYGYVLFLAQRYAESERELRRAIRLKEASATAHSYLGVVLIKLGRLDEAEKELLRSIAIGGSSGITAHRYLAALYRERGDRARAIEQLETYLRLAPNARDADQVRMTIKDLQKELAGGKSEASPNSP